MIFKERIDTGIRNNPSTGDVLTDGGIKINSNFDAIYNAFGDERLFDVANGEGRQVIHATGYYQKHPLLYYASPVELGSRHDIDTSIGLISLRLPPPKAGECIEVINSNGSFGSKNELIVQTETMDSFSNGEKEVRFRTPYAKIIFWCERVERGRGVWRYSIDNLYHNRYQAVEINESLSTVARDFTISHINDYRVIKLLTFYQDGVNANSRSSEILLHINNTNKTVYHTEYAVVSSVDAEIVKTEFFINGDDVVLRARAISGNNGRFIVKSIDSV